MVDVVEDEVAPLVVGRDPHYVERIWQDVQATTDLSSRRGVVSAALSAVDMAPCDLLAKSLNIPLYHLLGAHADDVACYASAFSMPTARRRTTLRARWRTTSRAGSAA